MGSLITAIVEGAVASPDLEYNIFRLITDRLMDYSINYQLLAVQFASKFLTVYQNFAHLVTLDDLNRLFLFDYDCSEIEANERSTLRNIVNKQFNILEKVTSVDLSEKYFYAAVVFAFRLFASSNLLRLDFLCTSIGTNLKRLCDGRIHINSLDQFLKESDSRRVFSKSLECTAAFRLLVTLIKPSLPDIRPTVSIFEASYYKFFIENYLEWDTPFEYYIVLDQSWACNPVAEFREDYVSEVVQKIKADIDHKLRKHGKLLRIFCKFYNRFSKDDEHDLPLKLVVSKAQMVQGDISQAKLLKSAFVYSVLTLQPQIINTIDDFQRKKFAKSVLSYDFKRAITTELEQENSDLADAFGTKLHYLRLLSLGIYSPISVKVTDPAGSNNRFFAVSICKQDRLSLATLYTRHTTLQDTSALLNTRTGKKLLSTNSMNAYQHSIGRQFMAWSSRIEDQTVTIVDVMLRIKNVYNFENADLNDMPVLGLLDHYLVVKNEVENSIEIFLHDQKDPETYKTKHNRYAYISLWRYGKLKTTQVVTFKKRSLLMLCFEDSRSLYFLDIGKRILSKIKLDKELLEEVATLFFDSRACRVLIASQENLALYNVKSLFAS